MHVVYLPHRYRSPKLRSFIDFMLARCGEVARRTRLPDGADGRVDDPAAQC
jgi:hypothetical protein